MDNVLKNDLIFWSRLGFGYDPPLFDEDGHEVLFNDTLSEVAFHKRFYDKGIRTFSFIVSSGWVGNNRFDYTVTDKVLDAAVSVGPEVRLLPRVKLNPPVEWCAAHPEELFVYYDGPRKKEAIRRIVGTPEHDYIGYDAPDGYYMGNPKYNRPNKTGSVARQSFASEVWLADAKDALTRFIHHVEERYPGKILGYHIAYGTSGETLLWGRINSNFGDYGIVSTQKFAQYLKETYNMEAPLPAPAERYSQNQTLREFMRVDNKVSVCYDAFTSEVNARAAEELCKTVKTAAPGRFAGVFYGYLNAGNITYSGHTQIEQLLRSPYVDFFAAPKLYYRCAPGDSGGDMSVPQSINLQKLWVDECDVRTYLASKNDNLSFRADDIAQTKNAFLRELSKNLANDSGVWLMDLGGGWYDDDSTMEMVGQLQEINGTIRSRPAESAADVLILLDEDSILQTSISGKCFTGYCTDFICSTRKTGVLADTYRLSDIRRIDLSAYKTIVFAYTLKIDAKDIAYIRENSNAAFIFNYAAGCMTDGGFSLDNTQALTGFAVAEEKEPDRDYPSIRIVDAPQYLVNDERGNVAAKTVDGRLQILNTVPYLDVHTIRALYEMAGCHVYSPENTVLYGDQRFITVLSDGNAYEDTVYLSKNAKWKNLLTGETGSGDQIKLTLDPYGAAIFLLED